MVINKGLLRRISEEYKSQVEEYEEKRQSVLDRYSKTRGYLNQLEDLGTPSNPGLVPVVNDVRTNLMISLSFQPPELKQVDRKSKPLFYSLYKFLTR